MAHDSVTVGHSTHTGRVREANQDAVVFYEPDEQDLLETIGRLIVIADGVGGHPGGDKAAQTAVSRIQECYAESDGTDPPESLRAAFVDANRTIHEMGLREKSLLGMGTTCTALVVRGKEAFLAHVGDSRAYFMRDGTIRQLTKDHSAAWALLEAGKITKEEYERHPKSRVIRRSLGYLARVKVDLSRRALAILPGDILLLCSDGLTGVVPDPEILSMATKYPPQEACEKLVARANMKGGPDNISVAIAQINAVPEPSKE
ncbi:MAG: protein phosphatase 2C domain-containing protein [Planctomycetota bacterium]|nr:protein phosphatase 2C domain-containing protein [Planctomycetota bacterium]